MKRTFIALPVDASPELKQMISYLRRELVMESVKWVETENFHITLKFLGDTPEDKIPLITKQIAPLLEKCPVMRKNLAGLNFFSTGGMPSVLYSEIEDVTEMGPIASLIDKELAYFGFQPESRPFKSHLTLARIKFLHDKAKFISLVKKFSGQPFGTAKLDRAVFYESFLYSSGPKYMPLKVFHFPDLKI